MAPGAKVTALLYVADTFGPSVNVYSYPKLNAIGRIFGFSHPFALCVDAKQNVYVTDNGNDPSVVEYAHGAATAMRSLNDHQGFPFGCAVDPKTGDLAIANGVSPSLGAGNVIVYRAAQGSPRKYTVPGLFSYWFVTYDDDGDLFLEGRDANFNFFLAELPRGKNAFRLLSLDQTVGFPSGLAWDSRFLAAGDGLSSSVYQFEIANSKAILRGSTTLDGGGPAQFWLRGGSAQRSRATVLIASDGGEEVHTWEYPAGGTPLRTISGLAESEGVAVSE